MYNLTKDKTLSAFYNSERTLKKEIHCRDDVKNKCFAYPIQEKKIYTKKRTRTKDWRRDNDERHFIIIIVIFVPPHR